MRLPFFILISAVIAIGHQALAQDGNVHLRVVNAMADKVDYYFAGPPAKYMASIEAGKTIDIDATSGQSYLFAQNRRQFEKLTVGIEPYQKLTLAPPGQQTPVEVSNSAELFADATSTGEAPSTADQPTAVAAGDDPGLAWQFSQFKNANAHNVETAQLIYGVPESDAIKMMASCNAGSLGQVKLSLATDVANAADKTKVEAEFLDAPLPATIENPASGEGLSGITFAFAPKDPSFARLENETSLTYGLPGGKKETVPLSTGAVQIGKFALACRTFAAKASKPKTDRSCDRIANFKRTGSAKNVTLIFTNKTDEMRHIETINATGMHVDLGTLDGLNDSIKITGSSNQLWIFTDGPGNCIETHLFQPGETQFNISIPSPGFGDGND